MRSKWCGNPALRGARTPSGPSPPGHGLGRTSSAPRLPSCAPTQSQVSGDHLRVTWAGPDRRHRAQRGPRSALGTGGRGPRAAAATALPGLGQLVGEAVSASLLQAGPRAETTTHTRHRRARIHTHTHARTHAPTATKRVCRREARSRGALWPQKGPGAAGSALRGYRLPAPRPRLYLRPPPPRVRLPPPLGWPQAARSIPAAPAPRPAEPG